MTLLPVALSPHKDGQKERACPSEASIMKSKSTKIPTTKEEVLQSGAKVLKTVPRNCYDPEKWQAPTNLFMNFRYKEVKHEDGTVEYVRGEMVYGDYKEYVPGSYCEQRVGKEMGLRAEDNLIALVTEYNGRSWMPIFTSDDKDNIEILFWTLDRELIPLNRTKPLFRAEEFGAPLRDGGVYHRTRLKEACDGQKYLAPSREQSEVQYPFIPPSLVRKWETREHIETLVINEGEFKAFKACMCGADVVGIGGIDMYKNTATGGIHRDVKRLVIDCEVKNLVILHDGDCTDVREKDLASRDCNGQPDKDLADRPRNFKKAADGFYKVHHNELPGVNIYWAYVNSKEIPGHPKGLDDLLMSDPEATGRIVQDLMDCDRVSVYFHRVKMNTERTKLSEHFFIDSVKSFYKAHKAVIDPEPNKYHSFMYMGTIYQWDPSKNELHEILSKDLMVYRRIGNSYYKESKKPTLGKDSNEQPIMADVLLPWSRGNIVDDYGSEVIKKLPKYDGFINIPSHKDFQKVIGRYYNMYRQLSYQPSDEDLHKVGWQKIYSTMEHIFGTDNHGRGLMPGDEGYDENSQFEIGMDYVQKLYLDPTQNLPILCLVSNERGTGKTSFLDLLQIMFADNMVIVGNDQMTSNFNTLISGRLVVGVDESNLADNKTFTEKLKYWSTAKQLPMEGKGKDAVMIENFTKYVLCSNNERRFIYASDQEVRFWVRKVPKLPKDSTIGNIKPYFEEEMPAFMAYLSQRKMWFDPDDPTKVDRMYFPPELLHTKALDDLLEAQRPRPERKMREWLHQWFIDFGKRELLATVDKLQEAIAETDRKFASNDIEDLKRYIEENMCVPKYGESGGRGSRSKRFRFEIVSSVGTNDGKDDDRPNTRWIVGNGRPYVFRAEKFLTSNEYTDLFPDEQEQGGKALPIQTTLETVKAFEENATKQYAEELY